MLKKFSFRARLSLVASCLIAGFFFVFEAFAVFHHLKWFMFPFHLSPLAVCLVGLACIVAFIPFFAIILWEIIRAEQMQRWQRNNLEKILNESCLVSRADAKGRIIDVNPLFAQVSGYKPQELFGKDHAVLNSGTHPKTLWREMYRTCIQHKAIWSYTVTNKNKNGELYWVKSWIMGEFDSVGNLTGYISVRQDVSNLIRTLDDIKKKNTYLEHAAKILRHDMHSGINTYIPRGLKSLHRRLPDEKIKELRIEAPLKLIEEGLEHTRRVYRGVFEFTNLVRENVVLEKEKINIHDSLRSYLSLTSYADQVVVCSNLPSLEVNEALFCTAVDNLIRNGLKYNDSSTKKVEVRMLDANTLVIIDNGRGLSQEDFDLLSKPYLRKEGQKEKGTGLGLNITKAILEEHGFSISCEKLDVGTMMKVTIK